MAQASGREQQAGRFALRTIALIVGLIGAILALIIDVLYSLLHALAHVTGVSNDRTHFFYGLVVVIVGAIGAFLAPIQPIIAAVLLVIAGIAFFFVVGWWALFTLPFFLIAAALTFSNRQVNIPGAA